MKNTPIPVQLLVMASVPAADAVSSPQAASPVG